MANVFSYNGIVFTMPNVQIVDAQAIYDAADVSVVFTKIKLRVTGTVQTDISFSFTENAVYIRQQLLIPRKTLVCTFAGDELTPTYDDGAGPKPRTCQITEIIGSSFGMVQFEVDCYVQEACATPSNVISHTYHATHALDNRFYTTRTVAGSIRLAGSASSDNPDALRGLITPLLPTGFKRESMSFAVALDGLGLDYQIVDKELFRTAPVGSTEARGTFSQSMSNYVWHNRISIELKGNKTQDPLSMFNLAYAIAAQRIGTTDYILQASVEEDLFDNAVRLNITTQPITVSAGAGKNQPGNFFPANSQIFTAVPGTESDQNDRLGPYGSALLQAAVTVWYAPCANLNNPMIQYTAMAGSNSTTGIGMGSQAVNNEPDTGSDNGVLSANQTGYVAFDSFLSFETVYGMTMLASTLATAAGKAYQMHNPYVLIHQWGSAARIGNPVLVPTPQTVTNGVIRRKFVKPFAPVPLASRQDYQYGAEWDYEIIVPMTSTDMTSTSSGGGTSGSPSLSYVDSKIGGPDASDQQKLIIPVNIATNFDPNTALLTGNVPILASNSNNQLPIA